MSIRPSAAAFWTAFVLNLALAAHSYSVLPAVVASHFDAAGRPNAYSPKAVLVGIHAGVVLFLGFMILVNAAAMRMPSARFNLPNKDYWMAPERREETLAWMDTQMQWFAAAIFVLMLDMFHQVLRMNLGQTRGLDHAWLSVGTFTGFIALWIAVLLRRFYTVPA
jgi:uncharacterized membrane protein